ncbi:hypothetical protein HaLaN_17453, partial [Haematococcus lacustris]
MGWRTATVHANKQAYLLLAAALQAWHLAALRLADLRQRQQQLAGAHARRLKAGLLYSWQAWCAAKARGRKQALQTPAQGAEGLGALGSGAQGQQEQAGGQPGMAQIHPAAGGADGLEGAVRHRSAGPAPGGTTTAGCGQTLAALGPGPGAEGLA